MPNGFVIVAVFPAAMLESPLPHPSAGRYPFAVASGVRSRFAAGFLVPCGAFGAGCRNRTHDILLTRRAFSQLN